MRTSARPSARSRCSFPVVETRFSRTTSILAPSSLFCRKLPASIRQPLVIACAPTLAAAGIHTPAAVPASPSNVFRLLGFMTDSTRPLPAHSNLHMNARIVASSVAVRQLPTQDRSRSCNSMSNQPVRVRTSGTRTPEFDKSTTWPAPVELGRWVLLAPGSVAEGSGWAEVCRLDTLRSNSRPRHFGDFHRVSGHPTRSGIPSRIVPMPGRTGPIAARSG